MDTQEALNEQNLVPNLLDKAYTPEARDTWTKLPREVLDRLEKTRISGQLIELKPDRGGRSRRDGDSKRDFKSGRDDRRGRGDRGRDDRPKRGRDDRGRDEQSWRDGRSSRPARKPRHK